MWEVLVPKIRFSFNRRVSLCEIVQRPTMLDKCICCMQTNNGAPPPKKTILSRELSVLKNLWLFKQSLQDSVVRKYHSQAERAVTSAHPAGFKIFHSLLQRSYSKMKEQSCSCAEGAETQSYSCGVEMKHQSRTYSKRHRKADFSTCVFPPLLFSHWSTSNLKKIIPIWILNPRGI